MTVRPHKTLCQAATASHEEKRSRFVASARPIASEEEALAFIREIRTRDWDARHHCHAYALDREASVRRSSDDGEPAGTAGIPILDVLQKQGITNAVIVVSRWFGGVLLGASGLVRAYGKAASLGVEQAGILVVKPCIDTELRMDYTLAGKVAHYLASGGYLTGGASYGADVRMRVFLEPDRRDALERGVADLTAARVSIRFSEPRPVAFTESGAFVRVLDDDDV